jgi:magnesium chelatase subunit I
VFRRRVDSEQLAQVVSAFDDRRVVHAGDDLPASAYTETFAEVPELEAISLSLARSETPGAVASAAELVLEGLHLTKRLNKDAAGSRAAYRSRS